MVAMCGQLLYSQTCVNTISGTVTDKHENEPLEFATVYIQETRQGIDTDATGNFKITDVCPGDYHFVVSHLGCESRTFFAVVRRDTVLNFLLDHSHHIIEEIEIKGKDPNSHTGLSRNAITSEVMLEMSGKSLSEIIRTVPGVSSHRSGPGLSKPVINGMYGNRITILNNGIPQEGQQWGLDHAPEIDPAANDKATVVRGSSAIRYGLQAIGGIVTVEPQTLESEPHLHGSVRVNMQTNGRAAGANATLRKSVAHVNARFYAGGMVGGDRHTPDYLLANTGTRESGLAALFQNTARNKHQWSAYYNYYHADNGILRGSHIGNLTDLEAALTRKVPFFTTDTFKYAISNPRQKVGHHLLKYKHRYEAGTDTHFELNIGLQANDRKEYYVRRSGRSETPALNLLLLSQYYDLTWIKERQSHSFSTGIQYRNGNNTNQPGTGITPLVPDYLSHIMAVYHIHKSSLKKLSFETGFRAEYRLYDVYLVNPGTPVNRQKNHFLNYAANLGFRNGLAKKSEVTLDISFTQRPPEINELYSNGLHQSVSGIELGDTTLNPETSWKVVNEWIIQPGHGHLVNLSMFYHRISDYIYLDPTGETRLTIRGAFPVFRYTGADVRLVGLSGKWSTELSKSLTWNSMLSYLYARNLSENTGLIRMPPFTASSQLSYTTGKSNWYHELKAGLETTFTARQTNVSPAEDFSPPPPGYVLLNANLHFKWKKNNRGDLELLIRCDNILDQVYRDYLNRLRYFADEQGRSFYITIYTKF